MFISVIKETVASERRVAITPDIAKKLAGLGASCLLESGIGLEANFADSLYEGADWKNKNKVLTTGDILLYVTMPTVEELQYCKGGMILVGLCMQQPSEDWLKLCRDKKLTVFAIEKLPRISRAQSMDALSSQASCVGYASVLLATRHFKRYLPMLTTSAGTIRPASILIIGAGVSGLQAIATAKRLGARVAAFDIRPEVKEQVESLGARYCDTGVKATSDGGYARELTIEEKEIQSRLLKNEIAKSDIVITTAGIPGKPPPKIVTAEMVNGMSSGSVIIDTLNGNCELTKPNDETTTNGVTIIGSTNLASTIAESASLLYSKNLFNYILPWLETKDGTINIDWEDEVYNDCIVVKEGNYA